MANQSPLELVLSRLGEAKKDGRYYTARCPAHDDGSPSLRIWEAPSDGAACVKCMSAGCSTDAIMTALQLTKRDLFPARDDTKPGRVKSATIRHKGEPVEAELVAVYPYKNREGKTEYEVCRWKLPDKEDGRPDKTFRQRRFTPNKQLIVSLEAGWYAYEKKAWILVGTDPEDPPPNEGARWFDEPNWTIYREADVSAAILAGARVWLTEGEKDADRIRREGETATTVAMGAGKWKQDYGHQLSGIRELVVWLDRDKPGMESGVALAKHLALADIGQVRYVMSKEGKDAYDHLEAGHSLDDALPCDPAEELQRLAEDPAPRPQLAVVAGGAEPAPVGAREAKRAKKGGGDEPPIDWAERLPPLQDGWRQPTSDQDNIDLFLSRYGEDIKFCSQFGQWLDWNGSVWQLDETGGSVVLSRWTPLARTIEELSYPATAATTNKGLQKVIARHRDFSLSYRGYQSLKGMAKESKQLAVTPAELDQHPDLLPCTNGTVDLRTGELIPNARHLLMTKRASVPYLPEADCPTWAECLDFWTAGDASLKRYLWLMAGYWLTGHTRERKFFFLYGPTKTGKTTFTNTLQKILGDYSVVLNKTELMKGGSQGTVPENIAALKGKRLSITAEVDSSDRFNEGLAKQLSGQDMIRARFMRENAFEFWATHKMVLFGNSRPAIYEQGEAIWDRIVPVPFEVQVTESQRNPQLDALLTEELPGILAWAVAGAQAWFAAGLAEPEPIAQLLAQYREDMDVLGQFLGECTAPDPGGYVKARALYQAYQRWAKETGDFKPMTETRFGKAMRERPGVRRDRRDQGQVYLDILVQADWDGPREAGP